MGEVAGRHGRCRYNPDQRRPEVLVVVAVPQFPQRDGDVVEPVTKSAVVEIDDLDLVAPEQRVVQMQVGVDETETVGALAQVRHDTSHAEGHPGKLASQVIRKQVPHSRGVNSPVDHRVAEERLPVPPDPHETGRETRHWSA